MRRTPVLRSGGCAAALLCLAALAGSDLRADKPVVDPAPAAPPAAAPAGVECLPGGDAYAVVVSRATMLDDQWTRVVAALRAKHHATVLVHAGAVTETRTELARLLPRHVCFVARPEEAGRALVISVHRLMRALDDDPYTDALWGILTGYEAADAVRIAERSAPLAVRRAAAGCGIDLTAFREGVWYSEGAKNEMFERTPGGAVEKRICPDDTTSTLVAELNEHAPDAFFTSGHATFRDWQIGYSYRNGQFRCEHGTLYGLDLGGKRYDVRSQNPKVYSAAGNCLMGLVADRESMALAWMRTGGVQQMIGYVVSTWFGYGGHGVNSYFVGSQGRHSFSEAFYFNQQALLARLEREYPRAARVDLDEWDLERDPGLLERQARRNLLSDREALGLLWDRDTVAFYGDPAWEARVEKAREPAYEQSLTESPDGFAFEVRALADGGWDRPPAVLLPYRVGGVKVTAGAEMEPIITDNFVLLPRSGAFKRGEVWRVTFTCERRS
ncbi:MAG: hypothetical protein HZA54_19005 [Planctomycetes bacterium]|nr:hypothetical protein [Planctomycetota bacterium]